MTLGPIDHLTLDAVVAFADGEMSMVAYQRAATHVARCPQCDAEVKAQMAARSRLRSASSPTMPGSLLDTLRSIPVALPSTPSEPPAGKRPGAAPGATHPDSGTPHLPSAHRGRRFRFLGAGAIVAGLTVGALAGGGAPGSDQRPDPGGAQIAHVSPVSAQVVSAGWGNP